MYIYVRVILINIHIVVNSRFIYYFHRRRRLRPTIYIFCIFVIRPIIYTNDNVLDPINRGGVTSPMYVFELFFHRSGLPRFKSNIGERVDRPRLLYCCIIIVAVYTCIRTSATPFTVQYLLFIRFLRVTRFFKNRFRTVGTYYYYIMYGHDFFGEK